MKNDNQEWIASGAKWITALDCDEKTNLYVQFVKLFKLDKVCELTMNITAVSQYMLWVNGQYVHRGPAVGDVRYYYYDTLKIDAEFLRKGTNVIAVLLYHDGDTIHPWQDNGVVQGFEYGKPGLLVHLKGDGVDIVSDRSWQVKVSEVYSGFSRVSRWGGYCESYHGEKEQPWMMTEYPYGGWSDAVERAGAICEKYVKNLVKLELSPLEVTELKPRRIIDATRCLGHLSLDISLLPCGYSDMPIEFSPGEYGAMPSVTFDFGTMTVGYPEIEIEGAFCIYEVWYGEMLDLYRLDVIHKSDRGIWKAFQRRAFRYLKINFIAIEGAVTLKRIATRNTWYAYNDDGLAVSSDETINKVIEISKHTLRMNSSYHFEDCPWREQALWIFDMRAMALIDYYYFGDSGLVAKNLRQCFALQNDDGSVNSTGPKKNTCYHPDFCMHLIAALREYYQYTGDSDLVDELSPYMKKLHTFIERFRSSDGLLDSVLVKGRGVPFLDWSNDIDKLGKSIIFNAVYSRYLDDIAFLFCIVKQDATSFMQTAEKLKTAVNALLFDAREGLYHDTFNEGKLSKNISLQGNMAALYGGFVPESEVEKVFEKLADTERFRPPYAPSFYLMIFETLSRYGQHRQILDHIRRYWGGMLSRQAVTWWEVFDPATPEWVYPHPYLGQTATYEMNWIPISTCHGWSGTAGYAIPRYLLGIDLLQLSNNRIVVDTKTPAFFDSFRYKVPVRQEALEIYFKKKNDCYDVQVLAKPKNIELILTK